MSDKHDETIRKKELATEFLKNFLKQREKILSALTEEQRGYLFPQGKKSDSTLFVPFEKAMKNSLTVPSEYISEYMDWIFDAAVPKRDKNMILYFADRLCEYPYSDSWNRRPYRIKHNGIYASKLRKLIADHAIPFVSAPLDQVLNRQLPEDAQAYLDHKTTWCGGYTDWQIAYALDMRDHKVGEAVTRIITEENGTGSITRELIRGVLMSRRSDFHELIGKLLLAAKLQEGLRQTICENADSGTKEAFLSILKVIDENNLIRFSSVKRAVGTWLGLLSEESREIDRIGAKSVRLILDCLTNENLREEYLISEDAMKIYIALWSYGFDDLDKAVRKIETISEHGSGHQLLVAGYFAANMDLPQASHRIAKTVLKLHCDKDDVLAVWFPCFLPRATSMLWDLQRWQRIIDFGEWFSDTTEFEENDRLIKTIYHRFSGKTKTFSPCVFPWYEAKIEKSDLAAMICAMAALSGENEKIDEACGLLKECDLYRRKFCFAVLASNPKTDIQRKTVLERIADKEQYTRKNAYDIAKNMRLTEDEYRLIEEYLRFKSADIREYTMTLLMKQSTSALSACISRLLESKKEDVRLGALNMISQLKKDKNRSYMTESFSKALAERANAQDVTSKEKILLDALVPSKTETKEKENLLFTENDPYLPHNFDSEYTELCAKTFEEYFPESELPRLIRCENSGSLEKFVLDVKEKFACKSSITAVKDLLTLSKLIEAHRYDEIEFNSGYTELLGNVSTVHQFHDKDGKFPLMPLWKEWIETNQITNKRIVCALILFRAYQRPTKFSEAAKELIQTVFGAGFACGRELPHAAVINAVLNHFLTAVPREERTRLASALAIWFIQCVPEDRVMLQSPSSYGLPIFYEMAHLLAHDQLYCLYQFLICENNDNLRYVFPLAVASAERCIEAHRKIPREQLPRNDRRFYMTDVNVSRYLIAPNEYYFSHNHALVGVNAYLLAAYQGLITEAQLYEFLLREDNVRPAMEVITAITANERESDQQFIGRSAYRNARNTSAIKEFFGENCEKDEKLVRFIDRIYENLVPVVLSAELKRGDSPAAYSKGIHGIARIYGAEYFAEILSAMGNDTLDRTAYYGWGGDIGRKSTLSYLLSVCIPSDQDNADTFRAALADQKITKKRLIEAALFSPEWIPFVGEYLGIQSFESVCCYFMAHMNEKFDDKRKAMIARFTPLSEEELNLGAFDVNWFRSAYESIGEAEFNLIYDAAKYITDGAKHSRARKYADASLGRLDIGETEKTVSDKRNKDLLMAYALIPITGEDDICRRYLYMQRFRKESKQFGSQRIASENKAVETALTNLAINAGYSDTMRLTLRMETKVIDDSRSLLEEQTVEDVSFRIVLDGNGKAELTASKNGRALKSIPAKLKKHETVLALSEMKKTLTEQYRRTRVMLERAMEDCTKFTFAELSALSEHPVVYPMVKNLVLISGDRVGFLAESGLSDETGTIQMIDGNAEIRIAHPFDLYKKGCWRNYQKYLFEHRIAQPFRQVFRELYIKTAEEMNMLHSLRYAGNQIQPAKTLGALKSRRWVADIEDGLQKIYYKENIVAQIYALADWFSPADIEAPTLEWVCFTDRKTGEELKISDIPEIVFSEVMRDVDLAVSVAHAGGVDPETSHSTMEMRAAVLSFVLPMFRIDNVKIDDRHARISGQLAEYSVHLGSGVVHQIGGAMIPVLPVHSQHRGKIFLPFVDEDPKTAEIISKVLLFAEDGKIKDPMILAEIRK